ncbi:hypothetical protein MAPG_08839 [Magnaporthiopsis poae ATCC 64411]|uniref:Clr5 domain-containing protein n=1 Tax=Magnaporthiopsis poae (strain ATCC 64411 / 73-15) TaxID=644358 RepID=A0A0C4E8D8_MAGP6|nr:hypothetical protein MAPG_08839 [Magnaporthiopsis poae ATCC 64411]
MAQLADPPMDRSIPHDKRWPLLKDIIVDLFIGQDMKIADVAKHMKEVYGFDAQPAHYRYRFKSWNIHKRVTAAEKDKIIRRHTKRSRASASTSDIVLTKGGIPKVLSENAKAQLRRYASAASLPTISPGFILKWNFPYAALFSTSSGPFGHPSPATSPFFTVDSPAAATPSPGGPINAPSPTTQALRKRASLDHVGLFLQGRPMELLKSLDPVEQKAAAVWFHDLFLFSFMSAKYFGKGPTHWSADLIAARSLGAQPAGASPPSQPVRALTGTPSSTLPFDDPEPPTMLCRWSIHYKPQVRVTEWCPDSDGEQDVEDKQDIEDEATWRPWTENDRSLPEVIREGITSGSFTETPTPVPVSSTVASEVLSKSPAQLEAEAYAFAIISGNYAHLEEHLGDLYDEPSPETFGLLAETYPFHQAAANLRGAKSCCLVMDTLVNSMNATFSIGMLYRNGNGHTVLDTLMVTILRSHTSTRPSLVCSSFDRPERFPGEGIDVCGRYDLDSPCIRRLFASGHTSVPMSWKHVFCHTSAQVICHSMTRIFTVFWSPSINTPSGIFIRTCSHCSRQLTPTPLHTLVVVAYFLATQGSPGETLFGVIAVLSCMLALGADPLQQSDLSPQHILSGTTAHPTTEQCEHAPATPLDLARALRNSSNDGWTPETRLGWDIFVKIMDQARAAHLQYRGSPAKGECTHYYERSDDPLRNSFCGSLELGRLWAAVQVELVTYRRLQEDQPWISADFDLQLLRKGLDTNLGASSLPLIAKGMLEDFSPCGWFVAAQDDNAVEVYTAPRAQDVCSRHIMNMDIWERTEFCGLLDEAVWIMKQRYQEASDSGQSSGDANMSYQSSDNADMSDQEGRDEEMVNRDGTFRDGNQEESNEWYAPGYQQEGDDMMGWSAGFGPLGDM